jgi:iron complex transport system ATP-binding protein
MISLKDIHIGFHDSLFKVNELNLERGKIYTLIGKNGVGKSTFLKSLAESIQFFKGEIEWDSSLPKEQRIAFVSSKFDGVENLSTYDYISLGRSPYTNIFGKLATSDHLFIEGIINLLSINHLINKETIKLSDGQRQIVSIARALTQNTELIILDEPTAFLDYENKIQINDILSKIAKQRNCCVIQSSHDLDISIEHSDFLLIVNSVKKELEVFSKNEIEKNQLIKTAFPSVNL